MNTTNRRHPRASTILAVLVAGIATVNAYLAMVAFAIDMVGMDEGTAYVTAGVFELSLFTVAVLAREAAKDNRPNGILLTLTWVLSGASGVFAAIHPMLTPTTSPPATTSGGPPARRSPSDRGSPRSRPASPPCSARPMWPPTAPPSTACSTTATP